MYAASTAMSEALERNHTNVVRLLEKHGGIVNATTAAYLGLTDRVRQLFEDEKAGRLPLGAVSRGATVADDVIEAANDGGHVELVRGAEGARSSRLATWRPPLARDAHAAVRKA